MPTYRFTYEVEADNIDQAYDNIEIISPCFDVEEINLPSNHPKSLYKKLAPFLSLEQADWLGKRPLRCVVVNSVQMFLKWRPGGVTPTYEQFCQAYGLTA